MDRPAGRRRPATVRPCRDRQQPRERGAGSTPTCPKDRQSCHPLRVFADATNAPIWISCRDAGRGEPMTLLSLRTGRLGVDLAPSAGGSIARFTVDGADVLRPMSPEAV